MSDGCGRRRVSHVFRISRRRQARLSPRPAASPGLSSAPLLTSTVSRPLARDLKSNLDIFRKRFSTCTTAVVFKVVL